jgi:hypothetical protein
MGGEEVMEKYLPSLGPSLALTINTQDELPSLTDSF